MISRISCSFDGDSRLSFNDEISDGIDKGMFRTRDLVESHLDKAVEYGLRHGLVSVEAAFEIEQAVSAAQFVAIYAKVDVEYRLSSYVVIHGPIVRLKSNAPASWQMWSAEAPGR